MHAISSLDPVNGVGFGTCVWGGFSTSPCSWPPIAPKSGKSGADVLADLDVPNLTLHRSPAVIRLHQKPTISSTCPQKAFTAALGRSLREPFDPPPFAKSNLRALPGPKIRVTKASSWAQSLPCTAKELHG